METVVAADRIRRFFTDHRQLSLPSSSPYFVASLIDICQALSMSQRLATTALSRLVHCGELRKLPVYGTTAPNLSVYTAVSSLSPPSNTIDNYKNIIDKKDTKIADSSLTSDPNATLKAIVTTLESKYNQLQEIQQSNNTHEPMAVELDSFMQQLHDYNEIKDIGQMLLGKCAEFEGCTIKEMHDRFSLHKEDMA